MGMEARKEPFTFECIELLPIPSTDVRQYMHGKQGVFVKPGYQLAPLTVLGPWVSVISFDKEYSKSLKPGEQVKREPYVHQFSTSNTWGEIFDERVNSKLNDLIGDGYSCGNMLRHISDCRVDPLESPSGDRRDLQCNCLHVEVLHNGWPYIFVVTTSEIQGGQEVIMSHSDQYWDEFKVISTKEDFSAKIVKKVKVDQRRLQSVLDGLNAEFPFVT
jgi:hypothetical protein